MRRSKIKISKMPVMEIGKVYSNAGSLKKEYADWKSGNRNNSSNKNTAKSDKKTSKRTIFKRYEPNGIFDLDLAIAYFNNYRNRRGLSGMKYHKYLKTDYWKTVRLLKLKTHTICNNCGSTNDLYVHHKTYIHRGDELNYMYDLEVLCKSCHKMTHGRLNKPKINGLKYNLKCPDVQLTAISW